MNAPAPQTTSPTRRLTSLDAVRGIASLNVLLCHCYMSFPKEARAPLDSSMWSPLLFGLFTNGDAAVIIFFVLSGCVLALPFFRGTQPSYPRYLVKRVCRIYIPFAVVISIAALLCHITNIREPLAGVGDWLAGKWVGGITAPVLAAHFLMTGTHKDMALDAPMWTLIHEMRVSAIFPLLILLSRDTRLAFVAAAIMLVASTRLLFTVGQTAPWNVEDFWITLLWTMRILPYFVLGILLTKHSDSIRQFIGRVPTPIRIALLAVPIMIFTISHRGFMSIRRDALYDIGAAMVVVFALDIPSIASILNRAVLQWLGRISYSVYLIHVPILVVMVHAFIGRVPLWLIILAAIVLALGTATLLHRFVEVPAMKLGKRVAAGGRATTQIAAAESSKR